MTPEARKKALEERTEATQRDRALFTGTPDPIPRSIETDLRIKARKRMAYNWRAVQAAIEQGKIRKPPHCKFCNNPEVEAHHLDYENPLKIVWLCRSHHDIYTAKRPSSEPRRTRSLLGY